MAQLDDYLYEAANQTFAYGKTDCVKFVTGWVGLATGNDPSIPFGDYDQWDAEGIIIEHGSLMSLLDEHLGLEKIDQPERGAIGVVKLGFIDELFCAICVSASHDKAMWAAKTERGIITMRGTPQAIWRVPNA
jgi:hypothetical protein